MALQTTVKFYIAEILTIYFFSATKTFIRGDFENNCQKLGLAELSGSPVTSKILDTVAGNKGKESIFF